VEESGQGVGMAMDPQCVVEGDHTLEGGMKALVHLTTLKERPTAVVCSNDMTAIGVMREAFDYGIPIPQELSVVGFDDIRLSQFIIPPLTTIQMSQKELARLALQAFLTEAKPDSVSAPRT